MQTHYAILKISKKATKREIKRAFFKLCLQHHPDVKNKLGGELNELNNREFHRITEAYAVLSDEVKRKQYDSSLGEEKLPKSSTSFNPAGDKNFRRCHDSKAPTARPIFNFKYHHCMHYTWPWHQTPRRTQKIAKEYEERARKEDELLWTRKRQLALVALASSAIISYILRGFY